MEEKTFSKLHMAMWGLTALLILSTPSLATDELSRILTGLRNKYKTAEALKISYRREVITKTMAMLGTQAGGDLASGKIFFMPPNLLKIDQSSPRIETLVTNGKSLWWYIHEEKKVRVYSSDQFGSELRALSDIWSGFTEDIKAFKIKLIENPEDDSLLELVPDPPWEQVDRIRVRVSSRFDMKIIEIVNTLGTTTKFYFDKITPVNNIDRGFFEFVVPEGVTVIREAG